MKFHGCHGNNILHEGTTAACLDVLFLQHEFLDDLKPKRLGRSVRDALLHHVTAEREKQCIDDKRKG